MVFFRNIFILHLVGLVLTYNFTNCNFKKIEEDYEHIIFPDLKKYMSETNFEQIFCYNQPECLLEIERHTFNPARVCRYLSQEMFALETRLTLLVNCPGYSRNQTTIAQEMKPRKFKRGCLNQTSQIIRLWHGFVYPYEN